MGPFAKNGSQEEKQQLEGEAPSWQRGGGMPAGREGRGGLVTFQEGLLIGCSMLQRHPTSQGRPSICVGGWDCPCP